MRRIDLIGNLFGKLTVYALYGSGIDRRLKWWCSCECGKRVTVRGEDLRSVNTKSCGCDKYTAAIKACTTHGACVGGKTKEYRAYIQAKARCNNKDWPKYKYYGGRGIQFNFRSFEEFFAELGTAPSAKHSVDRIKNDHHYEKGNVRWATPEQQAQNRRCLNRA